MVTDLLREYEDRVKLLLRGLNFFSLLRLGIRPACLPERSKSFTKGSCRGVEGTLLSPSHCRRKAFPRRQVAHANVAFCAILGWGF